MSLTTILHRTILIGIIAVAVLVPFIAPEGLFSGWAGSMFFPYIVGKNIAFRIGVLLLLGLWAVLMFLDARYRPRFSWILAAFAAFLLVVLAANVQGIDPFKSMWSNFERMEGYITLLFVAGYFLVAGSVLRDTLDWLWLWGVSVSASVLMGMLGVSEFAQAYLAQGEVVRIDTTFGNPIYYAVYALMHVFVALLLLAYLRGTGQRVRFYQVLLLLAALLNAVIVVLTLTRGTVLGLGAGLVTAAILIVLTARKRALFYRGALVVLVGAVLLLTGVFSLRGTEFAAQHPTIDRFVNVSLTGDTVHARLMNWGIAWQGVLERPFLGWGQENYVHVYAKYYDPGMWDEEPWFDRTHSFIFDWLIAAGFLGLAAYLALFAAILTGVYAHVAPQSGVRGWWQRIFHHEDAAFSPEARAVLVGLVVAYLVHNAAVFDSLTSYLLLALVLAFVHAQSTLQRPPLFGWKKTYGEQVTLTGIVPIVLVAVVAGYVFVLQPVVATAQGIIRASTPLAKEGATVDTAVRDMHERFVTLLSYHMTGKQEVRERMATTYLNIMRTEGLSADVVEQFGATSLREMEHLAEREHPSPRLLLFLGSLYEVMGMHTEAEAIFTRAVALGEKKELLVYQLASVKRTLGKADEAAALLEQVYRDTPESPEAVVRYGALLIEAGRVEEGYAVLENMPFAHMDDRDLEVLQGMWAELREYARVADVVERRIARGSRDPQLYATLAATYVELGDLAQARTTLQSGATAHPAYAVEFQKLLAQLQ